MTSRRTKISPKTGRGLGHMTHTIFGSTVGYPSDSLASCIYQFHSTQRLFKFAYLVSFGSIENEGFVYEYITIILDSSFT